MICWLASRPSWGHRAGKPRHAARVAARPGIVKRELTACRRMNRGGRGIREAHAALSPSKGGGGGVKEEERGARRPVCLRRRTGRRHLQRPRISNIEPFDRAQGRPEYRMSKERAVRSGTCRVPALCTVPTGIRVHPCSSVVPGLLCVLDFGARLRCLAPIRAELA